VTLPAEINQSYLQKPYIVMKYDTCAVSTVLYIIIIERYVIAKLNVAHLFHLSNMTFQHV